MRRATLALALAAGLGACFEAGQVVPQPSASPEPKASPAPMPSPSSSPVPLPLPFLPFVERVAGGDRLFLYDAAAQEVLEIPEAWTGGPILNPFYFEYRGGGRVLYNSGGVIGCPEDDGLVPDISDFGAYVIDLPSRLRYRLSEDDYFFSAATADGRLFAHLDVTVFPDPQRIALILQGEDEPFDEEAIVAELGLEPGLLVDLSLAAWGRWVAAVKGKVLEESCVFPPRVAGELYLYDLIGFRLFRLHELFDLPLLQEATLSPSGRQVILRADDRLLRLDRLTGNLDTLSALNQARGDGSFREVRFLAGSEEVFYLEMRPPGGRSQIWAYDWPAQRVNPLPLLNRVDMPADRYLAPPY